MIEKKIDKYLAEQKYFPKFSIETRRMLNKLDDILNNMYDTDVEGIDGLTIERLVNKIVDSAFEDGTKAKR